MKIYVSDDIYEYLTIGKRDIHSGVDDDIVVKSLEQHEQEIRKQERQRVIAELEEWINKNKFDYDEEYYKDYDVKSWSQINVVDIKQKLNEMKGEERWVKAKKKSL